MRQRAHDVEARKAVLEQAPGAATVAVGDVAVVALLSSDMLMVAAPGRLGTNGEPLRRASVRIAGERHGNTGPAGFQRARPTATVPTGGVAVITGFVEADRAIAASKRAAERQFPKVTDAREAVLERARRRAAVAGRDVAVVALLGLVANCIAASRRVRRAARQGDAALNEDRAATVARLHAAGRAAAITADEIPVLALRTATDLPVAANGKQERVREKSLEGARAAAPIAIQCVAVVALLPVHAPPVAAHHGRLGREGCRGRC